MKLLYWILVAMFFINAIIWLIYIIKDLISKDYTEEVVISCVSLNIINIIIQVLTKFIRQGMIEMTKEYIKQLCEMLLKDNLTQNGKKKIVNYIDNLQQRIDKVIDLLVNHSTDLIIICDEGRSLEINFKKIVSILQDEEVKQIC